jgi:peptidoglycan/xylan/chitin deacetylase (PgdA/CDA1 family)
VRSLSHETKIAKSLLRDAILAGLSISGILRTLARSRMAGGICVLAYHRVLTDDERKRSFSTDGIVVSRHSFEMQMRFLKGQFNTISLSEFISIFRGTLKCPDRAVLITFDDGWRDNYENAYPILKTLELPATIFLATNYIGTNDTFWQEEISSIIDSLCRVRPDTLNELVTIVTPEPLGSLPSDERRIVVRQFVDRLKETEYSTIDETLAYLRKLAIDTDLSSTHYDGFVNWTEVREMAQAGIEFGSHTSTHRMLDKIPTDQVSVELEQSKRRIEAEIGKTVTALAYPNGNYNADIRRRVTDLGFEAAFSMDRGIFNVANGNAAQIQRINIHEEKASSKNRFLAAIASLH